MISHNLLLQSASIASPSMSVESSKQSARIILSPASVCNGVSIEITAS